MDEQPPVTRGQPAPEAPGGPARTVHTVAVLLSEDTAVTAKLEYDGADPWAVTIAFRSKTGWVRWILGRELLAAGLLMTAGDGDVTVAPFPTGAMLVELRGNERRVEFLFDGHDIAQLLERSYRVVPLGAERLDWDTEEPLLMLDEAPS